MRDPISVNRPPRSRLLWIALALAALAGLSLAASASAEQNTVFKTSFGAAGSTPPNPYPLGNHLSIAVDNSSGPSAGDLYVADPLNHRIEKFDPAGHLLLMFGNEVNKTKIEEPGSTRSERNLCTIASGDVCQPGLPAPGGETPTDTPVTPTSIAVDSTSGPSAGDIYVGDETFPNNFVFKFDPSGHLVEGWAEKGRLRVIYVFGLAVGSNGDLLAEGGAVETGAIEYAVNRYTEGAEPVESVHTPNGVRSGPLGIDASGNFYVFDSGGGNQARVSKISPKGALIAQITRENPTPFSFGVDPTSDDLYVTREGGPIVDHYDSYCGALCTPFDSFGGGHSVLGNAAFGTAQGKIYLESFATGEESYSVDVFEDLSPRASGGSFVEANETSASVTGKVDPFGHGPITNCVFEYGPTVSQTFSQSVPCEPDPAAALPGSAISSPEEVAATFAGLSPNTTYRYRIALINESGTTGHGVATTFTTASAPTVDDFTSAHITENGAELKATINPHGAEATYHFEYGPTATYGSSEPVPDAQIASELFLKHSVSVHISGLDPNSRYHFRVIAENKYGSTTSADQTFGYYPTECPNRAVRQQTGANDLPDCRGYELVSPENAGNALIFPAGATPNTGRAISPARLAYGTSFGAIPGINGLPANNEGDMEVATRTTSGWVSKYVGLPSTEATIAGPPPYHLFGGYGPDTFSQQVLSNPSLSTAVLWDDGEFATVEEPYYNSTGIGKYSSSAPYVFNTTTGTRIDRWPTNLGAVPNGEEFTGETIASGDLSHFVFESNLLFAPGGKYVPEGSYLPNGRPGDVYDNDTVSQTVKIASRAQDGAPIEVSPDKVSEEGSRILMSSPVNPCGGNHSGWSCPEPLSRPVELFVREDGMLTHELAPGHRVNYVGMTSDASKIYFTSPEELVPGDTDTGVDLYMWSAAKAESTEPLTLVSAGNGVTGGNGEDCKATWIAKCGVQPISFTAYSKLGGDLGGNGVTDRSVAAESGEIYFLSPESLVESGAVEGADNLYVFRGGALQLVAVLGESPVCTSGGTTIICSEGPVARMNISPNGGEVAFITSSRLTAYDNGGHAEMYSYDPVSGHITCDSCRPDGASPQHDVLGSQNGLFMSNDGRTFFSTADPLVPQDTNEASDVYEFTEGRPQLISSGTAAKNESFGLIGNASFPGLDGVSVDGVDVYFSTFDVLVGQDQNGQEIKIYDARTGGGFPFVKPPPSCSAADECHGPGTSQSALPANGTGAGLSGRGQAQGRAVAKARAKQRRRKNHRARERRKHRRHRQVTSR